MTRIIEHPLPDHSDRLLVERALEGLSRHVVEAIVRVLETEPSLLDRVMRVAHSSARATAAPVVDAKFMRVDEYARHARVSGRTIRGYVAAGMVEGEHFHREGRKGRCVVIHVEAADAWRSARRFAKNEERTVHDLATNEILRRRAVLALKKGGR